MVPFNRAHSVSVAEALSRCKSQSAIISQSMLVSISDISISTILPNIANLMSSEYGHVIAEAHGGTVHHDNLEGSSVPNATMTWEPKTWLTGANEWDIARSIVIMMSWQMPTVALLVWNHRSQRRWLFHTDNLTMSMMGSASGLKMDRTEMRVTGETRSRCRFLPSSHWSPEDCQINAQQ